MGVLILPPPLIRHCFHQCYCFIPSVPKSFASFICTFADSNAFLLIFYPKTLSSAKLILLFPPPSSSKHLRPILFFTLMYFNYIRIMWPLAKYVPYTGLKTRVKFFRQTLILQVHSTHISFGKRLETFSMPLSWMKL